VNTILPLISEKNWQGTVIQVAQLEGWEYIYHTWNSKHSPAGYPDLIFLKDGRMVVVELKREDGLLSAEQYFWLLEFTKVTPDVYLWKPSDWGEVQQVLCGRTGYCLC